MFLDQEKELIKRTIEDKKICAIAKTEGMATLIKFLTLAEDRRFYEHNGFDIKAIIRALYKNIFLGCHEGASTIDQQLVRVITNDYRYKISRKIKEIILAIWLDRHYTKRQISACYLSVAYYGTRYPKLDQYLNLNNINIRRDELREEIAANIIARLKYPEPRYYNSIISRKISNRVKYILYLNHNNEHKQHDK